MEAFWLAISMLATMATAILTIAGVVNAVEGAWMNAAILAFCAEGAAALTGVAVLTLNALDGM